MLIWNGFANIRQRLLNITVRPHIVQWNGLYRTFAAVGGGHPSIYSRENISPAVPRVHNHICVYASAEKSRPSGLELGPGAVLAPHVKYSLLAAVASQSDGETSQCDVRRERPFVWVDRRDRAGPEAGGCGSGRCSVHAAWSVLCCVCRMPPFLSPPKKKFRKSIL